LLQAGGLQKIHTHPPQPVKLDSVKEKSMVIKAVQNKNSNSQHELNRSRCFQLYFPKTYQNKRKFNLHISEGLICKEF
jgi:hypothetical protein